MTTLGATWVFFGASFIALAAGYFAVVVYAWQKREKRNLEKWRREQEWEDENSYH
jgi:hypothetical protein